METAVLMTRGTVWLALLCYVAAIFLLRRTDKTAGRVVWVTGCVLFLLHVAAAFQFYHEWSHAKAAEDTGRQTLSRIGINFSAGLYFNYLFAAMWIADSVNCVLRGALWQEQQRAWHWLLHAYSLFMIFNGTIVFGHGWARPIGAMVCILALTGLLWRQGSD